MIGRALGYKPDRHDPRDHKYALSDAHLPAAVTSQAVPYEADCLRLFAEEPLDQNGYANCLAQVIAQGVRACHVREGRAVDPPLLSRRDLWYKYRYRRRWQSFNEGGYFRDGFDAVRQTGFCQEKYFPHDLSIPYDEFIKTQPPTIAEQHCHDQRVKTPDQLVYRRLEELGEARIERLQQCVLAELPPQFGTDIGRQLTEGEFDPDQPIGPPPWEDIVGGHGMIVGAYRGSNFLVRTSWGEFANRGWFWMNADYALRWTDIWLTQSAPYFSEETP